MERGPPEFKAATFCPTVKEVTHEKTRHGLLLVVCEEEFIFGAGATGRIVVTSSSSSTGDPAVVGSDCAPALAPTLNGGFRISNVTTGPGGFGARLFYTLKKKGHDS